MNRRTSQASPRGSMQKSSPTRRIKASEPLNEEKIKKCNACKKEFKKSSMHRIKTKLPGKDKPSIFYYCDGCYDDRYFTCDECGELARRDDERFIESESISVCERCYEDEFTSCYKCDRDVRTNETTEYNDEYYCEKCADKYLARCVSCDEYCDLDSALSYGGDYYCESCAEDFVECSICEERFPEGEIRAMGEGGNENVCVDCIENENLVQCSTCRSYFGEDEIETMSGRKTCMFCSRKGVLGTAEDAISDADIDVRYPGLEKRIGHVFDRSAKNRAVDARTTLKILTALLPTTDINLEKFTYVNPIGATKPLTDLMAPKNTLFKNLDSCNQQALISAVNTIQNIRQDTQKLVKEEKQQAIEKTYEALKLRMFNEMNDEKLKNETDALEGRYTYPYTQRGIDFDNPTKKQQSSVKMVYTFLITKDPVAILSKSTSQCWESMSCEKVIRGQFGSGAFSDISLSNLACFIIDEHGLPVARIMIRWCKTEKKDIDFGIEKKWYYCTSYPDTTKHFTEMGTSIQVKGNASFLGGLRVNQATKFLVSILKNKGKLKDYKSCTTPYAYGGYSDTEGKGMTRIHYNREDVE